ncbi:hypothetical protein GCM10010411_66390 [Actinomadura fulvescens]|uniref:DUF397 domain-containing protein n=2 Tax=Actinomadura fulvescens TaxID=46160 RepID=A0ABN3QAN9_9ACTN
MRTPPDNPQLIWRKASRSSATGNDCVEIASTHHGVAIRDSKNPNGPKLTLSRSQWRGIAAHITADELKP